MELGRGRYRRRIGEGAGQYVHGVDDVIGRGERWLCEVLMTEFDCVGDGHGLVFSIDNVLTAVVIERRSSTKTMFSAEIPRFPAAWLFVNDDRDAKRAKGRGVVVEWTAMQIFPRALAWIHSGLAQEVEGELGLLEEFIPQVFGKVGCNSSQDGEEMRLECSDCALCRVATMHVRGDELVAGFPNFRDDAFIFSAGLVVKYLEVNFVAKGR